jgi:hypothetical protein
MSDDFCAHCGRSKNCKQRQVAEPFRSSIVERTQYKHVEADYEVEMRPTWKTVVESNIEQRNLKEGDEQQQQQQQRPTTTTTTALVLSVDRSSNNDDDDDEDDYEDPLQAKWLSIVSDKHFAKLDRLELNGMIEQWKSTAK